MRAVELDECFGWKQVAKNKALSKFHVGDEEAKVVVASVVSPERWQCQLAVKKGPGKGFCTVQVGRNEEAEEALASVGFNFLAHENTLEGRDRRVEKANWDVVDKWQRVSHVEWGQKGTNLKSASW